MTIDQCKLIEFSKISNRSGNLSFVNNCFDLPFEIKRVFYLYDVPSGESRGAHAHKECHQVLIAISGSFEVLMNDGKSKKKIPLNCPSIGLYIPPGIWASEINFSSGAICLVLASHTFNELDYIRNFKDYKIFIDEATN